MTNPITEERLREIEKLCHDYMDGATDGTEFLAFAHEHVPDLVAEVRRLQAEITDMKWACEECMRTRVNKLDKVLHSMANEFCVRLKVGPVADVIKHHLEVAE